MKYIKTYENFKPIKINNAKPFKVKKNIDKGIKHLQRGIKALRRRINDKDVPLLHVAKKNSDLNKQKNDKIHKLKDLQFKKLKQQEYFRNNPVKESYEEDSDNLITILSSSDFNPDDIVNLIGIDKDEYKIAEDYYNDYEITKDGFTILIKSSELEYLMDVDEGNIKEIIHITDYYSQYEFYVDDSELDYLHYYITSEIAEKIKKLAKILGYKLVNIEETEGEIKKFFDYIGLSKEMEDFKSEISMENERAVEAAVRDLLKNVPFKLSVEYTGDFDLELEFEFTEMIEYMKKHKLNVKTIKEFLENIYEADEFSMSKLENETKQEFIGDFKDLNTEAYNVVDKYLIAPDEIFIRLIECGNLELFKKKIKLANFGFIYDITINYDKKRLTLFDIAKHYKGAVLEWFKSNEFEKIIMKRTEEEIDSYGKFIFGENIDKYNL